MAGRAARGGEGHRRPKMGKKRGAGGQVPVLPLLPLRSEVVFPMTATPLIVGRPAGMRLLEAVGVGGMLGLVTQKNPELDDPSPDQLHEVCCVGSILKMLKFPDGSTRVVVQGVARGRIVEVERGDNFLLGKVEPIEETAAEGVQADAMVHHLSGLFDQLVEQSQGQVSEELMVAVLNTREPGRLADLLASSLPFSVEEKQEALAEPDALVRLERLGPLLARQLNVMEIAGKIQAQVGNEINKAQREHFLREQLRAIQAELDESEPGGGDSEAIYRKVEEAGAPPEALRETRREIDRLAAIHTSSAEYSIVRTYLDWIGSLPWSKSSRDRLDLRRARKILDADHYDLEKVKDRILDYLAVRKLKSDLKGPILCLVGPPGTGKTSLGRSIARTMGREFVRISLGGVHDESELRGHRRTYVAAMPGRILQALRKAGTNNPVFLLDEIDKLGSNFRGDPAAALLEILDPEQNATFRDSYLDLEFNLSKVLFLATANATSTIPHALLDRMEVLELNGYSEEEKLKIARRFVIPKQLEAHGLDPDRVEIGDDAVRRIISDYTREAGLRNLEREIATVCRKVARRVAEGSKAVVKVPEAKVAGYLGPSKYYREIADRTGTPGVATGLAWTPSGGEILFIEATALAGKGTLTLTGLLGDSMRESAQAALTYLRQRAKSLGLDPSKIQKADVHIHVPAGAVPKDGPSAGVAIASALISLFDGRPIRPELAMTGEVTLTGRVLPVGGVREKVLAARRAGIKSVLIPHHNEKDLVELPKEVRDDLIFHYAETLDDVTAQLFVETAEKAEVKPRRPRPARFAASTDVPAG